MRGPPFDFSMGVCQAFEGGSRGSRIGGKPLWTREELGVLKSLKYIALMGVLFEGFHNVLFFNLLQAKAANEGNSGLASPVKVKHANVEEAFGFRVTIKGGR